MIITAIKRMTLVALFGGVTLAGLSTLATDRHKANELASIEIKRAKTTLQLEQASAQATMTALEIDASSLALEAALRAEKEAAKHEQELDRMATLAPIWTGAQAVFIALATGGACFVVYVGTSVYQKRSEPIVTIRNVPVTRDVASNHAAMLDLIRADQANTALVRLTSAQNSGAVPHHYAPSVTYAPHTRQSYQASAAQVDPTPTEQPDNAPRVPTFAQLLRSGVISPNQDAILYGFDDKQERYMIDFDKLTSTLIFGNSGSGKTTTLANLIGQLALNGFNLEIIDPHRGHEESLSERLKPLGINQELIAQDNEAIEKQARHMLSLLEQAKKTGEDVKTAWILDEVTAVLRNKCASVVQQALEAIAQEGRKYKLVAYAASQATRANRFGDSSVRDSFPIIALHRLRRAALRSVGLTSSDEFARVEKLSVGVFMLDDGKNEPLFLTAPFIDQSDLLTISGTCQPVLLVPSQESGGTSSQKEPYQSVPPVEHVKDTDTQECEALNAQTESGTVPPTTQEIGENEASQVVPSDLVLLSEKEAKAALLAKETDMSANAIYKVVGGSRGKIQKIVKRARATK